MRRRRILSEAEQRERTLRDGDLAVLTQHPSWPTVEATIARKEENIRKVVLAHALGQAPFDQRLADYARGYIDGMHWFVNQPHNAEMRLERAIRETQREEVTT